MTDNIESVVTTRDSPKGGAHDLPQTPPEFLRLGHPDFKTYVQKPLIELLTSTDTVDVDVQKLLSHAEMVYESLGQLSMVPEKLRNAMYIASVLIGIGPIGARYEVFKPLLLDHIRRELPEYGDSGSQKGRELLDVLLGEEHARELVLETFQHYIRIIQINLGSMNAEIDQVPPTAVSIPKMEGLKDLKEAARVTLRDLRTFNSSLEEDAVEGLSPEIFTQLRGLIQDSYRNLNAFYALRDGENAIEFDTIERRLEDYTSEASGALDEFETFISLFEEADNLDAFHTIFGTLSPRISETIIPSLFEQLANIVAFTEVTFLDEEAKVFVMNIISMREGMELSPLSKETPIIAHLPQHDIEDLWLLADKLQILPITSKMPQEEREMILIRLTTLLCIGFDTRIRISNAVNEWGNLPQDSREIYYYREAALVWNTLCPLIAILPLQMQIALESQSRLERNLITAKQTEEIDTAMMTLFEGGIQLTRILNELDAISGTLYDDASEVLGRTQAIYPQLEQIIDKIVELDYMSREEAVELFALGPGAAVQALCWSKYTGGEPAQEYPELKAKLSAESDKVSHILNRYLLDFSLDQISSTKGGSLRLRGRAFHDRAAVPIPFKLLEQPLLAIKTAILETTHPARTIKGRFPWLWKLLGLRFYDQNPRKVLTPEEVKTWLRIYERQSFQPRIDLIRQKLKAQYISDGITLTSLLPLEFAFVNGFYHEPRTGKKGELHPWVINFASYIENEGRFKVLAIDQDNAKREDLPFIQFIIFDTETERIIEWRIFRWKERQRISITHTEFKHAPEIAVRFFGAATEGEHPRVSPFSFPISEPDSSAQEMRVSVGRKGHQAQLVSVRVLNTKRQPTNLDIALALGNLSIYLGSNPPFSHMIRSTVTTDRHNLAARHPLEDLEPRTGSVDPSRVIRAVDKAATDGTEVHDYLVRTMHLSPFDLFLLILNAANVRDKDGNPIPASNLQGVITMPRRQRETLRNIIDLFFRRYLDLEAVERIALSKELRVIIPYLTRTLSREP